MALQYIQEKHSPSEFDFNSENSPISYPQYKPIQFCDSHRSKSMLRVRSRDSTRRVSLSSNHASDQV